MTKGTTLFLLLIITLSSCDTNTLYEKSLDIQAEDLNKQCPKMIDELTRMDSVKSSGNLTLSYYYTLPTFDVRDMDTGNVRNLLTEATAKQLKANDDLVKVNEIGGTYVYYYRDSNNKYITTVTITPEMYKR